MPRPTASDSLLLLIFNRAPCRWRRHLHLDPQHSLSHCCSPAPPKSVSKIFSTNRHFDLEMSTKTDRPQELPGEEGSRHRGGEDGDGTVSAEREDGEQGHPSCHQVCPRGSVRVPIGKAGRTHRDRGRLHTFFSQGREQALTAARGGPRTGKT